MSLHQLAARHPLPGGDLSEILGPSGIKVLLELIRDAYYELVQMRIVDLPMTENQITEEWYVCLLSIWPQSNAYCPRLTPIHQKEDESARKSSRGSPPTIDFCFRARWDRQVYFGAECKLIEANNKTLCRKYIEKGVNRYIDGRYGQKFSQGAMLGYVRQTKCSDVAAEIRNRINHLTGSPKFVRTDELLPFEDHYISEHSRLKGLSCFTIHHLLFLFEPCSVLDECTA